MSRKRVGLISCMHESNSFNPLLTDRTMFEQCGLLFGEQVIERWADAHHEIGGMLEAGPQHGLELIPIASTWAMPSGPVQQQTFDDLLAEILRRTEDTPMDGLLLSLHGAMVAEDDPDPDGHVCRSLRRLLGPRVPIVLTLDLHANISSEMIRHVDATTVYRTNPHVDQRDRGREAARIMGGILDGRLEPVQALEKPDMLVYILSQRTNADVAAELVAELESLLKEPGLISASLALGFPYADVEKMGPAFLAVADRDADLARRSARRLARLAWERRAELVRSGLSVDEAAREVASDPDGPVTLLDVGDNVGGGSAGDGTVVFEALRRHGVGNSLVVLYDPQAARECAQAGIGQSVRLMVGGKTDRLHGPSLPVEGRVRVLHDGLFIERQVRHGGCRVNNQGLTAVVETAQEDSIVLTSLRMAPFSLEQIISLGIRPESKKALIAKGAIAPRAAYEPVSTRLLEVDSPGITFADPARFNYQHRRRPLYPLEENAVYAGEN